MRITISISNPDVEEQDLLSLDIFPDMTLDTLRSSIEAENGIPATSQHLYHNGVLITDGAKTMEQLQIGDGEMLALHVRDMRGSVTPAAAASGQGGSQASAGQDPGRGASRREQDPELIRLQILGDPRLRAEIARAQPQVAAVLDDPERFAQLFANNHDRERRERLERQRQIQQLNADPFDVEAQTKIAEIIRQERVMENLQNAMEHNPEVFGRVHLLYADVEVNGHKVKALVDSGAQATIMSPACAEECGIMRLVDKRFAGVARGVGTATIIGRVHTAPIKIGSLFLPCSFTVMEGKSVDLLLGLDMLKRYQATIDLTRDRLIIQGEEIAFLGEADIPKEAEEALAEEPTISGPGGATIGQRSGAVTAPAPATGGGGSPQQAQAQQQQTPTAALPAATTAPAAGASSMPGPPARPTFSQGDIDQLMALGFDREAVIRALTATSGNVEYAANHLCFGQR